MNLTIKQRYALVTIIGQSKGGKIIYSKIAKLILNGYFRGEKRHVGMFQALGDVQYLGEPSKTIAKLRGTYSPRLSLYEKEVESANLIAARTVKAEIKPQYGHASGSLIHQGKK